MPIALPHLDLYCDSTPCCVQLVGEGDIDGTQLLPWQQQHQGSVAALDICTETTQVPRLHMQRMKATALGASSSAQREDCVNLCPKLRKQGCAHSMLTVLT